MDRRTFVQLLAASQIPNIVPTDTLPQYRVNSRYRPASTPDKGPGMPGPYPGVVISVKSAKCLDQSGEHVDVDVVKEMMARGMCALTSKATVEDAWRRFFEPSDVVGIKVNCGGRPWVVSAPEIVVEAIRNLTAIGVKPSNIYIYERFQSQLDEVNYGPHLPEGCQIVGAENQRGGILLYDPDTYVEVNFFGEEDTRSNVMRLVSQQLTKIINIPNMKDHGATGVTGCLKNIAYGSFSNVARSHFNGKSHTYSFVGTLAAVEPVRSRTVLQIMDGLRGVWHGGPFAYTKRYVFYPRNLLFGTDPVAIDRLLLDIIEQKRKAEGAISVWDRGPEHLKVDDGRARDNDPNVNIIIREPGHIEYASKLGLGVHQFSKIRIKDIEV
jgi:Domain of unknown function (DUF362)